jgi:quercetin dioxygenase-like cupin family protein
VRPDDEDVGGDPPCWAHLFEEPEDAAGSSPVVADLGALEAAVTGGPGGADGPGGAVWSLPHGGDLDANLVRLPAGGSIGEHVNELLDVLLVVRSGSGELIVDGRRHPLRPDTVVLLPHGTRRALSAGPDGLGYLSVHRRRPAMTPRPARPAS